MPNQPPDIESIIDYWARREPESGLGVDWLEADERCWRCGYEAALERCHIVPRARGGSNKPSNFVLLCSRCHREAPDVDDPRFMWIWLRRTCVPFYDTYWMMRGAQEFEKMFGRLPFDRPEFHEVDTAEIQRLFRQELKNTVVHFGEGMLSPATLACVLAKTEEKVIDEPISAPSGSYNAEFYFKLIGWKKRDESE